jgi:hypothetical protein
MTFLKQFLQVYGKQKGAGAGNGSGAAICNVVSGRQINSAPAPQPPQHCSRHNNFRPT